jgi:membrane protease YdiL (CAAX protease family)
MLISALLPFVFLNKCGRNAIGIKTTRKWGSLVIAVFVGLILAYIIYFIGNLLYENSYLNWYKYIGKSYNIPDNLSFDDKRILFIITAGIGAVFSPVGEEFFFRGIIQGSFANSLGEVKASVIDSLAFALTHLAHFGIVFVDGKWDFYALPAFVWFVAMFITSFLFTKLKKVTNSVFGAVLCHAGFNIGMTYCIFYLLN